MRRKLALLLAGLAAGALVARLFRRRRSSRRPELSAPEADPGPDPRADALRRQLAASREGVDGSAAGGSESASSDVDEARRRVHQQGRAAVDEMRRSG